MNARNQDETERDLPLLTLGHVRQLRADIIADEKLIAEIQERIAKTKKKLAAALEFVPDGCDLGGGTPSTNQQPLGIHPAFILKP